MLRKQVLQLSDRRKFAHFVSIRYELPQEVEM